MFIRGFAIYLLSFFLLQPQIAFAWNATGHRLVAQIAWTQLKPQTKIKVNTLIHRLDDAYGPVNFVNASVWADWIRGHDVSAFDQWHYINCHLNRPVSRCWLNKKNHIIWAIAKAETVLNSQKANTFEKAFFLRFLIHLVGDAHQPLHTVHYVGGRFPRGDAGGNAYKIHAGRYKNLHAYWDAGLGTFQRHQIKQQANEIMQAYPKQRLKNEINQLDPRQWVAENHAIANAAIYKIAYKGYPSKHYRQKNKKIVDKQIALAGYRLAKILNHWAALSKNTRAIGGR